MKGAYLIELKAKLDKIKQVEIVHCALQDMKNYLRQTDEQLIMMQ